MTNKKKPADDDVIHPAIDHDREETHQDNILRKTGEDSHLNDAFLKGLGTDPNAGHDPRKMDEEEESETSSGENSDIQEAVRQLAHENPPTEKGDD